STGKTPEARPCESGPGGPSAAHWAPAGGFQEASRGRRRGGRRNGEGEGEEETAGPRGRLGPRRRCKTPGVPAEGPRGRAEETPTVATALNDARQGNPALHGPYPSALAPDRARERHLTPAMR
ncbi:unnamed protein product, partial [Prorocentrum cordatum]